jgi:putative membrane protein
MDPGSGFGGWGWGMGFGWMFMLLFWALIILAIAALAKWLWGKGGGRASEKTALQILEERYARGEIGREEFEQKKRDLSSG